MIPNILPAFRRSLSGCLCATALCLPVLAHADPVSMELTGVEGPSIGGVYTSPYVALVGPAGLTSASQFTSGNSSSIAIYCDDYLTEVSTGQVWQATVTNFSALAGLGSPDLALKFDTTGSIATQQQDYMAAAYLAESIAGLDQSTTAGAEEAGQLSYAIWSIFDPDALEQLSGADLTAANNDITAAYAAVVGDSPNDFSNVNIYTPSPTNASQEYLSVNVPEPATQWLLTAGLLAIGLLMGGRLPRRLKLSGESSGQLGG